MKKAETLLGDSSAILRFGDDEALMGEVGDDLQFRWRLCSDQVGYVNSFISSQPYRSKRLKPSLVYILQNLVKIAIKRRASYQVLET